jgi:hypothetical protein
MTEPEDFRTDEEIEAERDPNNAGNPLAVRAKTKAAQQIDRTIDEVLRVLLTTKEGRLFVAYIVLDLGKLTETAENAAYDSNALHFREGARAMAAVLHNKALRISPTQYMELMAEHSNKM